MNVNMTANFGGLFKFEVHKAETNELVKDTGWFHNLVLDQGLDMMATESWFYGCAVGTDGTPPIATQTALGNQIAFQGYRDGLTYGTHNKDGVCYLFQRRRWRFAAGKFNNTTLAEVAITTSSGKCWNRALITDTDGKPTTITLLSDEYLDVTCEVRCYLSLDDVVGAFDIVDKAGNVLNTIETITRPAGLNNAVSYNLDYAVKSWVSPENNRAVLTEQTMGDVTAGVNNSYVNETATYNSNKVLPYVVGSHQISVEVTWGLNDGNKGKWVTLFTAYNYFPMWQISFSEPISKTDTQTLTMRVTVTWGRHNVS